MLYQLAKIADLLDDNGHHKDADFIERLIEKISMHEDLVDFQDIGEPEEDLAVEANLDLDDYEISLQTEDQIRRTALDTLGETLIEVRGEEEIRHLIKILQDLVSDS